MDTWFVLSGIKSWDILSTETVLIWGQGNEAEIHHERKQSKGEGKLTFSVRAS